MAMSRMVGSADGELTGRVYPLPIRPAINMDWEYEHGQLHGRYYATAAQADDMPELFGTEVDTPTVAVIGLPDLFNCGICGGMQCSIEGDTPASGYLPYLERLRHSVRLTGPIQAFGDYAQTQYDLSMSSLLRACEALAKSTHIHVVDYSSVQHDEHHVEKESLYACNYNRENDKGKFIILYVVTYKGAEHKYAEILEPEEYHEFGEIKHFLTHVPPVAFEPDWPIPDID